MFRSCGSIRTNGHIKKLKSHVLSNSGELDFINAHERKDETPMTIASCDRDILAGLDDEDAELQRLVLEGCSRTGESLHASRDRAPTKLLQTEIVLTVGVSLNGRFMVFTYACLIPLQEMARTTGEVYYDGFMVNMGVLDFKELAAGFKLCSVTGCSDGATAIERSYRGVSAECDWLSVLRFICKMHKAFRSIRRSVFVLHVYLRA